MTLAKVTMPLAVTMANCTLSPPTTKAYVTLLPAEVACSVMNLSANAVLKLPLGMYYTAMHAVSSTAGSEKMGAASVLKIK